MKIISRQLEKGFEKLTSLAIAMIGNSITFIIGACIVIFWLSNKRFYLEDIHYRMGVVILGCAFLFLFIVIRSYKRYAATLNLSLKSPVEEPIPVRNNFIHAEENAKDEVSSLSEGFIALVERTNLTNEALVKNVYNEGGILLLNNTRPAF